MNTGFKPGGVVVPMITPVTEEGGLDEPALDRLVEFLIAGGVHGIFVMGTTGEGVSIPRRYRRTLVQRTVDRVGGRVRVYAGIGDAHPREIAAGNDYLRAGADAVVARPPISIDPGKIASWYRSLLDGLTGPLILYNMPLMSLVSIPLEAVEKLAGHPRLAGIKDSENNPRRLKATLQRFGGRRDFSVFVGVGALMEKGLRLGADGIVPSVANLVPGVCCRLYAAARRANWTEAKSCFLRMNAVSAIYQNGRALGESLAALKAAAHCRGLCAPHVLPPLRPLPPRELEALRGAMRRLSLLNGGT
ncbi:MAG: dihydrodipicolinate synthase family protein [Verrucomicrobiota bacterium]|nr:dihydrodipicolinate synthase family protein [Verrucomicrobiota bacterium]